MSSDWRECSLGDLITIKHGFAFSGEHISKNQGKCILVTPGNFEIGGGFKEGNAKYFHGEYPEEYVFVEGDLIVTMTDLSKTADTLGYSAKIPAQEGKIYLHNQRVGKILSKSPEAELDYLYWVMRHRDYRGWVVNTATGSTVKHTSPSRILEYSFQLPTPPEQKAIAHILGTLDDKIELNRKTNETLEAMAKALFKSWFVDFDPVRAKAEGRPTGLPDEISDLFPDSLEDSELGEIPSGWEVKRISDITERVAMGPFGSNIKVETFVESGIPVISGAHLKGVLLEDSEYRYVTEEHAQRLSNSCVSQGDIIFTHAGSIGQVAIIPDGSKYSKYVLSQRQFYARPLRKSFRNFIAFYFHTATGRHVLLSNTSQTGVPSIARPATFLKSIELAVPDEELLCQFEEMVSATTRRARHIQENTIDLRSLRDTLLPKLISGEIRIPDAEKMLEEVGV